MWMQSVLISLIIILGTGIYVEAADCGTTTLSATSNAKTLEVKKDILSTETICKYTINGVEGQFVQIDFEKPKIVPEKADCQKPFVKLEAATGEVKIEIATLCQNTVDKTYYSPGSQTIITIQGKAADQAEAFNITYKSVSSVEEVCGETALTAGTANLNNWNAPKTALAANQICVYKITASSGEVVQLNFTKIAVSAQSRKAGAVLKTLIKLENLKNGEQTLIANLPPGERNNLTHKSIDETMIVTLFGLADLSVTPLFTAKYKSVTDPYCGPVNLEATEQSSTEWKFPLQTIKSARDCTYKIQAAKDQKVQLDITALDFEAKREAGKCSAPYLELKNFADSGTTPIKVVCDTKVPQIISSNTSAMIVKLHGAANLKKHAVTATYKAVKDAANNVLLSFSSLLITALVCLF